MSGPLTAVLACFRDGATSLAEVSARTGLSPDVVRASVEHLVRIGRLEARELAHGCPSTGCGGCAAGTAAGAPGCGAPAPGAARTGSVLVALSLPRRDSGRPNPCR